MRCTEVADRSFPDGEFICRDIGDRGRSLQQENDMSNQRSTSVRCPRCDGDMEEGFIQDLADANWAYAPKWISGPIEKGFLGNTKTRGREAIPVVTLRCVKCGRLESFAID